VHWIGFLWSEGERENNGVVMSVDVENPVIRLCVAGTRAEFEGNITEAHRLYLPAWDTAGDDYEACIAAHYSEIKKKHSATMRWLPSLAFTTNKRPDVM
jgi:hypothetical protein